MRLQSSRVHEEGALKLIEADRTGWYGVNGEQRHQLCTSLKLMVHVSLDRDLVSAPESLEKACACH